MLRRLVAIVLIFSLGACSSIIDDGLLAQADKEYAQGNYLKAENLYERYLQVNPNDDGRWGAWQRLVEIAVSVTRDYKKGTSLLESMRLEFADDPRLVELNWQLAEVYTTTHDWEKAAETWQTILDMNGGGERAWEIYWNLGKIHQFQGRYAMSKDAMMSCMDKAKDSGPRAQCMYELAQAFSLLKNREQAKAWLQRILDLKDVDAELRALSSYLLAEQLETDGDIDEARTLLESIADTYPNPKVIQSRLKNLKK